MKTKIIFRTDASVDIGIGHVMRCLTLADKLTELGAASGIEIAFASSPETVATIPNFKYPIEDALCGGDILIIDHYELGIEYEQSMRDKFDLIMVIDDIPNRRHECDILLDQTFGRQEAEWRPLIPQSALALTGAPFMLLRQEFESLRARCEPRTKLESIFVSLGGTDPYNVTDLVLEGIRKTRLDIPVTVAMGANAPHLLDVKDKARSMSNVIVMTNARSMAALMVNADLAIGAGGVTAWERCCLGLPSLVLEIADNQKDVIHRLVLADAALECPIDDHAIYEAILLLHNSPEILTQMSFGASAICSGNGAQRVAQMLLDSQQG